MSFPKDTIGSLLYIVALIGPTLALFFGSYLWLGPKKNSKRLKLLAGYCLSLALAMLAWLAQIPLLFISAIFIATISWWLFCTNNLKPYQPKTAKQTFILVTPILLVYSLFLGVSSIKILFLCQLSVCLLFLISAVLSLYRLTKTAPKGLKPETTEWLKQLAAANSLLALYFVMTLLNWVAYPLGGPILFSAMAFFFGGRVFTHPEILADLRPKYQNSKMDGQRAETLWQQVVTSMEKESLFVDTTFSLEVLGKHIQASPKELSQLINQRTSQNFTRFVNTYRVGMAKRLLATPEKDKLKIAAIAYDCGFNSTSAFNAAFKRETGTSPSVYRNEKKEQ